MKTAIVVLILLLILGGAVWYIYRSKKKGVKCIGCPSGGKCTGHCASCASSRWQENE